MGGKVAKPAGEAPDGAADPAGALPTGPGGGRPGGVEQARAEAGRDGAKPAQKSPAAAATPNSSEYCWCLFGNHARAGTDRGQRSLLTEGETTKSKASNAESRGSARSHW